MLKATVDAAVAMRAIKSEALEQVIVDTTVQEKAIAHPVDSPLLEISRHKVVSAAKRAGIGLKQTYARKDESCGPRPVAMRMPNRSAAWARRSSVGARSWAW